MNAQANGLVDDFTALIDMNGFATHPNEHLDEYTGMLEMVMHGNRIGYRFRNTLVRHLHDRNAVTEQQILAEKYFPLGTGGGWADEHGKEFRDSYGRKTKECTASLIAQRLGLIHDPAWSQLISWVRHADRTADVRPEEVSTLIKGWHLLHPNSKVRQRVMHILADMLRFLSTGENLDLSYRTFSIQDLMSELYFEHREEFASMEAVRSFASKMIKLDKVTLNGEENRLMTVHMLKPLHLINVINMWQYLYRDSGPAMLSQVRLWAKEILADSIQLSAWYQAAYDAHVPNCGTFVVEGIDPATGQVVPHEIRCDYQETSNPFYARVARAKGAGIVIIKSPKKGNVAIFTNKRKFPHIDMDRVVTKLRQAEMAKRSSRTGEARPGNLSDYKHWSAEEVPEVKEWYYMRQSPMILNGSDQSSSGVPATTLASREIYGIIADNVRFRRAPSGKSRYGSAKATTSV